MPIINYLTDCSTNINAGVHSNTTALHMAIRFRSPNAVAGLLQRGADPTLRDERHNSDAAGWARACINDNPNSDRVAELLGAT